MKNVITVTLNANERALMISAINGYFVYDTEKKPIRKIYKWIKLKLMMAKKGTMQLRLKKINADCLGFALWLVKEERIVINESVDKAMIDRLINSLLHPIKTEERTVVA